MQLAIDFPHVVSEGLADMMAGFFPPEEKHCIHGCWLFHILADIVESANYMLRELCIKVGHCLPSPARSPKLGIARIYNLTCDLSNAQKIGASCRTDVLCQFPATSCDVYCQNEMWVIHIVPSSNLPCSDLRPADAMTNVRWTFMRVFMRSILDIPTSLLLWQPQGIAMGQPCPLLHSQVAPVSPCIPWSWMEGWPRYCRSAWPWSVPETSILLYCWPTEANWYSLTWQGVLRWARLVPCNDQHWQVGCWFQALC